MRKPKTPGRRNPVAKALSNPVCRPQMVAARKGAGSYRRKARNNRMEG